MANLAVLASGNGSNFEAIALAVGAGRHRVCCLISDKTRAYAVERAARLCIPSHIVRYGGRPKAEAEGEILQLLRSYQIDLVVLAGYMRLLSPLVVDAYSGRIINIHPSLLPKYPGVNAIANGYFSRDREMGITVHWVDCGMDTGPVIVQKSIERRSGETLHEIETRIHELEHRTYPEVVMAILEDLEDRRRHVDETGRITT